MTTQLELDTTYAVRRGGIADVTHVTRLLESSAPRLDLDGDGTIDGPADPVVAASVTRLALSHVVLQHGEMWVADLGGVVRAASIWVPTTAITQVDDLSGVVARELDPSTVQAALDPGAEVRSVLAAATPQIGDHLEALQPDALLTGLAADPRLPRPVRDRLLVACAVRALEERDGTAAAVAFEPERVAILEEAGFVQAAEIPVGEHHRLWVGFSR
ncbi:hypothetical protein FE697_005575 [Mumia zhuanghuii]|uniref:N-acetyltransferase domain-containing protein n=2 Tax=Mumia TaxID=1546255 RepID=A0ABW1QIE2_9ACTN|nr:MULTISPECIES: hypothetical protein [Mumia]KAA1425325.1 hypothetical protein FE697_005575 [Mumia zhuanghuii]